MPLFLLIPGITIGHLVMWMTASRLNYRHYNWGANVSEEDRRFYAGLWGLIWPLTLTGCGFYSVLILIGWNMARPTRAERRELERERLAEEVRAADAYLDAAPE